MEPIIDPDEKGDEVFKPSHSDRLLKALTGQLVHDVEEMHIIKDDLDNCWRNLTLYYEQYFDVETNPEDSRFVIKTSLFRDAVTLFCACFSINPAERIKLVANEIYGHLDEGWKSYYQYIRDLRDSYAAHNFGPVRQCQVFAIMEWNDAKDRVRFVGTGHRIPRFAGLPKGEKDRLLAFIGLARDAIVARLNSAREELDAQLLKIGPDALFQYPDLEDPEYPKSNEVRIPRDRFLKSRKPKPRDRGARKSGKRRNLPQN